MKHSLVICISALAFVANVQGASYVTDFNSFDDQLDVAGQDGWVINDPTLGNSFIVIVDDTVTPINKAAALGGGLSANPAAATVALTHPYGEWLGGTLMGFDFAFIDSTNADTRRDTFGVTLRGSGGSNLFTVFFSPDAQSSTPEELSPDAKWNLSYGVGSETPGAGAHSLTQGVLENGYYSFYLQFTPNGSTTDFELKVSGGTTEVRTGNIAIDPTTVATDFGLTWTPTNLAAPGDNYLVVDNFSVVPEASSSLLCIILATLVTTHHRRRTC